MTKDAKAMSVGQAAKKAGISTQSLQYYLMMGVVKPSQVSDSGRRLFVEEDIARIVLVKELNDSGYSLRDIRELFVERRSAHKGGAK
jgi:DNA-binding transcriptional MerR regulator